MNNEELAYFLWENGQYLYNKSLDDDIVHILDLARECIANLFVGFNIKNEFSINFIDNENTNAYVVKINETYYICLYKGFINNYRNYIYNVYSKNLLTYEAELPSIDFFSVWFRGHNVFSKKKVILDAIFVIGLFFSIMHEVGHILCGHKEINGLVIDYEQNTKCTEGYFSQAKEYWADLYGIANSYNLFWFSYCKSRKDIVNYTTLYFAAIDCLISVFNEEKFKLTDNSKFTHAHPLIRKNYMHELIAGELLHSIDILKKRNLFSLGADINDINKMLIEAYVQYMKLYEYGSPLELKIMDNEKLCELELQKIKDEANNVAGYYREKSFVNG